MADQISGALSESNTRECSPTHRVRNFHFGSRYPPVLRPSRLEWVFEAYGELLNLWCHPQDLDEYEHACLELTQYMLGRVSDSALLVCAGVNPRLS